jgi:hypothetical protein
MLQFCSRRQFSPLHISTSNASIVFRVIAGLYFRRFVGKVGRARCVTQISGNGLRSRLLPQRPDCAGFVLLNIKDSQQSCHLEQVEHRLVEVYQPKLPTLIPNRRVSLDQLADS